MTCPYCGSNSGYAQSVSTLSVMDIFKLRILGNRAAISRPRPIQVITEPVRHATIKSDFVTPFLQSMSVSTFLSLTAFAVCNLAARPDISFSLAGSLFSLSGLIGLWSSFRDHRLNLCRVVEEFAQIDIDGDGHIGKPEPPKESILNIVERTPNGRLKSIQRLSLPVPIEKQIEVADLLLKGVRTEAQWEESKPDGVGVRKFRTIRDKLISLKRPTIAYWIDPNDHTQSWDLTSSGRAMLQGY